MNRKSAHQSTPYERNVDVTQRLRHGAQSELAAGLRRGIKANSQVRFGNTLARPVQAAGPMQVSDD